MNTFQQLITFLIDHSCFPVSEIKTIVDNAICCINHLAFSMRKEPECDFKNISSLLINEQKNVVLHFHEHFLEESLLSIENIICLTRDLTRLPDIVKKLNFKTILNNKEEYVCLSISGEMSFFLHRSDFNRMIAMVQTLNKEKKNLLKE